MFRLAVLCAADWITPAFRASLPAEFVRARLRGTGAAAQAALDTHTLNALVTFFPAHALKSFFSTIPSKKPSSHRQLALRRVKHREGRGVAAQAAAAESF